jgi:hypothetical protein
MDSDLDGVGDNADWAPNNSNETQDSDGDMVGDNADAFPNDANETLDTDGDGVGDIAQAAAEAAAAKQKEEDEQRRNMIIIAVVAVIIAALGVTMFLRKRGAISQPEVKEYGYTNPSVQPTNEPVLEATPSQLQILNQWTDESGYTWRKMSDGSHHYWDGNDWVKHS